jgi:hypothetical protein
MDFKKLGRQVGQLQKTAKDKLGDRAEPENLKRDGKELRNIMSGDGSLAEKAKEAKKKVIDRDQPGSGDTGKPREGGGASEAPGAATGGPGGTSGGEPEGTSNASGGTAPAGPSGTPDNQAGERHGKRTEPKQ